MEKLRYGLKSGYFWFPADQQNRAPRGLGWYKIGVYDYEIGQDLIYLYSLIPFSVRKKLPNLEIGGRYWSRS
jgi:hypothetical protein